MSTLIQLGKLPSSPTKEQEKEMFEKYHSLPDGDEKDRHRHFIASHYLLFVHFVVHQKRKTFVDMPYDDTFQQGVVGLMEAIDKFDIEKGFRFTSYVSHYIFKSVVKELETHETQVKLPGNTYFKMKDPDYKEVCRGKEYYSPTYFKLDDMFNSLSGIDLQIMQMYYGHQSDDTYTLVEIGDVLGLSKERVRQRREQVLERFRRNITKRLQSNLKNATALI